MRNVIQRRVVLAAVLLCASFVLFGIFYWRSTRPAATGPAVATSAPEAAAVPESLQPEVPQESDARQSVSGEPEEQILALLDPEGAPASHARAAIVQEGALAWKGLTNETGEIAVDRAHTGPATLLGLAPSSAPQTHAVELVPGRQEVRLRLGAVVSGGMTVNGQSPAEALPLELHSDHPLLQLEELGVTWEALGLDPRSATNVGSRTELEGSFRFYGLPPDWRGSIWLPRHLRPRDARLRGDLPNSLVLGEPKQGLAIDLVRLVRMHGRILETPGGKPVPGANVQPALLYTEDVGRAWQGPERADAEGRFQIILLSSKVQGGHLLISSSDRLLTRKVAIEPEELVKDKDLGDLALADADATVAVNLLVVDASGAPIAGAAAGTDEVSPASMRTGEDGRTLLRGIVPGVSVIEVHALGYQRTLVTVPPEVPQELVVTMTKSTLLTLVLRKPDGEPARAEVVLRADEPLFADSRPMRCLRASMSIGQAIFMRQRAGDGHAISLRTGSDGQATLTAVSPGIALDLAIMDSFGELIEERTVSPLGAEEHRRVEIVLSRAGRNLFGRVVGEDGLPIAGAMIGWRIWLGGRQGGVNASTVINTDHAGCFGIKDIYAATIDLEIRKDDYVPFRDERFSVPSDDSPVAFVLKRGSTVTVTVEDRQGQRFPASVMGRFGEQGRIFGSEVEKGLYLLRGLPDEPVTITAIVHQVSYVAVREPGTSEVRITVPDLGEVTASIHLLLDEIPSDRIALALLPKEGSGLSLRRERLEPRSPEWPIVFTMRGVVPGEYTAVVQISREAYSWESVQDVSPPQMLRVLGGQTTRIQIYP